MAFYKFLMLKSLGKYKKIKMKPKGRAKSGFIHTSLTRNFCHWASEGWDLLLHRDKGLSAEKKVLIIFFT